MTLCIEIGVANEEKGNELIKRIEALRPFVSGLGNVDLNDNEEGQQSVSVYLNAGDVLAAPGDVIAVAR